MPIDADGPQQVTLLLGADARVGVVDGALVVQAEHVLDVLDGELALGHPAPRQVVRGPGVLGAWAVPVLGVGLSTRCMFHARAVL